METEAVVQIPGGRKVLGKTIKNPDDLMAEPGTADFAGVGPGLWLIVKERVTPAL